MDNFFILLLNIIEKILIGDNNISMYLITIIAGLFGFIIASIPLTIQLLEIKGNKNIDKINSNLIMKKKIFSSYITTIQSSFFLFLFILFVEFLKIVLWIKWISLLLFIMYIYLIYNFILQLYRLINILKELIYIYINDKK